MVFRSIATTMPIFVKIGVGHVTPLVHSLVHPLLSSFHFLWAIHPIRPVESLRPTPFPHVCVSLSLSVLSLLLLFPSSHSTIYFQAEDIPTEPNEAADDVAAKAEAEKVSINSYAETSNVSFCPSC